MVLLAEDAQNIAGLRRCLRSQVSDAKAFIVQHGPFHTATEVDQASQATEAFARIDEPLQDLEQTMKDLLQLVSIVVPLVIEESPSLTRQEFAWVSINEAQRSTNLGLSMKRLSWITVRSRSLSR